MIVQRCFATKGVDLPLAPKTKKPPKLIFLDVGLVNFQMGLQSAYANLKDLNDFYRGRIAEQITGQNLVALSTETPKNIFYWYKGEKSKAEVDFCFSYKGKIVGVEVKIGKEGKLRSAFEFLKKVKNGKVIRIYSGPFEKNQEIISLPFYFLPRILDVVI